MNTLATSSADGLKRPDHIALIMDGNGRWAQGRGLPRIEGHRRGVATVRMVTEAAAELELSSLTLYCLSSENWKRPQDELSFLMQLLQQYLVEERRLICDQGLRLELIGRRDRLSDDVLREVETTQKLCLNNAGTRLVLAIDYGGRDEIVRAAQAFASDVARGKRLADSLDEDGFSSYLDTPAGHEIDLMIRTGGDTRISNFLLWQVSYAELWFTDKCWPEFAREDFDSALDSFARRQRRFGGLDANG
ncbi:MAG: polyprenyl diphosphate synthase [Planctomycetota bacterium]